MAELRSLRIQDFRNIEGVNLNISSPFVCFYGENAQGKTNILESIYLMANVRSFRNGSICDWIKSDKKSSYVCGKVEDELGPYELSYSLTKNERKYSIDDNRLKSIKEIISRLRIISYGPGSYELVLGDDGERRRFLDRVVYSIDPSHLDDLIVYNKALKNRNASIKQRSDYSIWNSILAKHGSRIVKKRVDAVKMIRSYLDDTYLKFFNDGSSVDVNYCPTCGVEEGEMLERLIRTSRNDEDQGATSCGPHRDRIEIRLDGVEAKRVVSTGQAKLISFIFKISKLRFIRSYSGKKPIFLYDDVSAFLDEKRLLQLIDIIKKEEVQIISTAVDNNLFKSLFSDSVQFITVREGRVFNDC